VRLVDVVELDDVLLIDEPNAAVEITVELRTLEADVNHKVMIIARATPASNNPTRHPLQHAAYNPDLFLPFLLTKQSKLLKHPTTDPPLPV
jgi:hypothetical protein